MTVSVSNTNINDSFNTWRLNTNFVATVISNNVVTVSRDGSANRGGVAKGNGHVAGTFTANELRTVRLHSGNTSNEGNFIQIASNTSINATSLTVTANTIFQGNVDFVTSGTDRLVLGDISRVRVTGGTKGQFLRVQTQNDVIDFKSLTLRDISDLSTNSAPIILSASNTTFSDNGDSPAIIFAANNGTDKVSLFLASNTSDATSSDLIVQLSDTSGESRINITDSANSIVAYIDSDGNIVSTVAFLPSADDAVDLGSSGAEFKDAYIDGVAYIDELSVATGASQGVSTSLIPKTDAAGNLGSTTRKWGTVWADTTNGGAGVFNTLGISSTLTVNGAVTFNGDVTLNSDNLTLDGNTIIGDASTDTVTFNAQVDSDFDPQTGSQRDIGSTSNRWHRIYANTAYANNASIDNNLEVFGDLTVLGSTTIASGQAFEADSGVFTSLGVLGTFTANGNVDLGNATTDSITVTGQFDSALIPITDDTYDLGSASKQWQDLYIDGTASIDTLTVDELATFNGDRITVSGNGFFSDSIDVADSIDVTNSITNDGTVMLGKNGKLHANNTITDGTLTSAMLANTMTSGSSVGNSTSIPVLSFNNKGQITGFGTSSVSGVTGVDYTQSNNVITVSTSTTAFKAPIDSATTTSGTGRGVASFDSGDFSVSSGHVTLANGLNGAVLAISGTTNEVNVSRSNGTVTVGLPDDVTVTGQLNVGENVVISGNLTVSGTTTTVDTQTVLISDNIITLNSDFTGDPALIPENGGISVERGTGTNVQLRWNETSDRWEFTNNGSLYYNIPISSEYDNYGSWTIEDHDGTSYTVTSGDTLSIKEGNGIDSNFTGDDQLTITNTKPFDDLTFIDGDSTSVTMTNNQYMKFVEGSGTGASIDINFTDTSDGTSGDPYDLTFTVTNTDKGSDQNIFKTIAVTDTDSGYTWAETGSIVADTNSDTVTFVSGTGVDIDADATNDAIRIEIGQAVATTSDVQFRSLDVGSISGAGANGQIRATNDIVAHYSDERLKDIEGTIPDALEKVKSLRGFYFTENETAKELGYNNDARQVGVSAQAVQKVLPEVVKDAPIDDKYLTVQYEKLVPLLIEAIKELTEEVEKLKSK